MSKLKTLKELSSNEESKLVSLKDVPNLPEESLEPSAVEAAIRGAAQGISFGTADELTAALEAAKDVAVDEKSKLQDLLDLYRKHREESREAYKAAEEAHPIAYFGGELASAFVPGMGAVGAVGKLGKAATQAEKITAAAKSAAKIGALYGAGQSEADLTEGDVAKFGKDVGAGALAGTVTGLAVPAVGAGVGLAKEHPFIKDIIEAGKAGLKGKNLIGLSAGEAIEKEQADVSREFIEDIFKRTKDLAKQKVDVIEQVESSGKKFNIVPQLKELSERVENLPEYMHLTGDKNKLKQFVDEQIEKNASKDIKNLAKKLSETDTGLDTDLYKENIRRLVLEPENFSSLSPKSGTLEVGAKDLNRLRKISSEMTDIGEKSLASSEAKGAALDVSKSYGKILKESHPEIPKIDTLINTYNNAQEILLKQNSQGAITTSDMAKIQNALGKKMVELEASGKTGTSARQMFKEAFDEIAKVDKGMVDKYKSKMLDVATMYDLNRAISTPGLGGGLNIHGKFVGGANILGSLAHQGTEIVKEPARKVASIIRGSTPENIISFINGLSTSAAKNVPSGLVEKLGTVAQQKNEISKNALMFSILQQPEYRNFLTSVLPDTDE